MRSGRTLLIAGLLAGAAVRIVALPLRGTDDLVTWKIWSFAASYDLTSMYGVGGAPPERRVLHWQGETTTVDYPPIALAELSLAGRAYHAVHGNFEDSRMYNGFVKLPGLAAELLLIAGLWWIFREHFGPAVTTWTTLAIWLNPALMLDGSALGYLDAQMAVPVVFAVWAAWRGRPVLAGSLAAIAVLTKVQAVFALPAILALVTWRSHTRLRALTLASASAAGVSALVLLPYVVRGAWANLAQAVGRLATHDMLSAQAPNVWWIVTWWLRVADIAPEVGWVRSLAQEVKILGITRAVALGYPNPRLIGSALVGIALLAAVFRVRQIRTAADAFALTAWSVYAYSLFAAQVHENHAYLAVLLLAPAAAIDRQYRVVFYLVTGILTLNLYLFYGFGFGWPPLIERTVAPIDLTVLLSVANVCVFGWFSWRLWNPSQPADRTTVGTFAG